MKRVLPLGLSLTLVCAAASGQTSPPKPVPVTADNFVRAETDMYFTAIVVKDGALGKFHHNREPEPVDAQEVIRTYRDTLYSAAVFDLDAGPGRSRCPTRARASCRCR